MPTSKLPIMHPTGFQLSMATYWRRLFPTICTTTPPFHILPGAGILIHYLRYGAVFSGNKLSILTLWIKTCDFLSAQKIVESLTIVLVNQLEVQKVDVHPVYDSKQRWWVPVWLFTSMMSPLENGPHRLRRRRMSDIFHPLVENHEEHEWVDVCVFLLNSQDVPQPIGRWKEDFLLL